jgi:hypothetical protein
VTENGDTLIWLGMSGSGWRIGMGPIRFRARTVTTRRRKSKSTTGEASVIGSYDGQDEEGASRKMATHSDLPGALPGNRTTAILLGAFDVPVIADSQAARYVVRARVTALRQDRFHFVVRERPHAPECRPGPRRSWAADQALESGSAEGVPTVFFRPATK